MAAGTCVVACGTAGEETGWVEAFEGALREGGGCAVAVAVGALGEGGEEEEEEGEGEMGGEDGHFICCFFGVGVFFGDDECGNVGVDGIAYEVERMCAGCFSLFML